MQQASKMKKLKSEITLKKTVKGPSETQIQQTYMQWLRVQYPWARKVTFSIPNGGKRSYSYAARLKREGLTKGALDLIMCVARHGYHGLAIEFKRKGGKPTEEQKEMIKALQGQSYKTVVWDNLQVAMEETREYLGRFPRFNQVEVPISLIHFTLNTSNNNVGTIIQ